MKYLVTGRNVNTGEMVSPEQFTQIINKGIILNLKAYHDLGIDNGVIQNKNKNCTKTGVAIVDANTDAEVNDLLENTPAWFNVNWNVSPLENF
jgi:hypothetical protein